MTLLLLSCSQLKLRIGRCVLLPIALLCGLGLVVYSQRPHIVTHMQSSAWRITKDNTIVQTDVYWQPTMGYWEINSSGSLVQNTDNIPGWDFLWEKNSSGSLVQ